MTESCFEFLLGDRVVIEGVGRVGIVAERREIIDALPLYRVRFSPRQTARALI